MHQLAQAALFAPMSIPAQMVDPRAPELFSSRLPTTHVLPSSNSTAMTGKAVSSKFARTASPTTRWAVVVASAAVAALEDEVDSAEVGLVVADSAEAVVDLAAVGLGAVEDTVVVPLAEVVATMPVQLPLSPRPLTRSPILLRLVPTRTRPFTSAMYVWRPQHPFFWFDYD